MSDFALLANQMSNNSNDQLLGLGPFWGLNNLNSFGLNNLSLLNANGLGPLGGGNHH